MIFALILVFITQAGAQQCGYSRNAPDPKNYRIVNGEPAPKGAWPWIVPLIEDGMQMCGGSIINNQWIVTAAHCFPNYPAVKQNPREWSLDTGDHEVYNYEEAKSTYFKIEYIIKHEKYLGQDPSDDNDIALIKVKGSMTFGPTVQPICLAKPGDVYDSLEKTCFAAGWGESFGTAENIFALQQVHSEIVDDDVCNRAHFYLTKPTNICFGDGRKGTCMGDSGGPLMCKRGDTWNLVGVTSWGNGECKDQPGVFTEISHFNQWIYKKIAEYS